MVGHNQHWSLARDILSTPDLPASQEDEKCPYYYSEHIIEPGHYSTPPRRLAMVKLYLVAKH
jgi:hypothetical protein